MNRLGEWDDDAPVYDLANAPATDLDEAPDEPDEPLTHAGAGTVPAPPRLYYGSVDEFVREFICPTFRRNVGEEGRADYRWSARWWESAEAITRLEAIWRAWEYLRLDASTGTSVWLRDHADHHLAVLMSPTGPWALSRDTAGPDEPLPYQAPPEGMFPHVREG